jgi:predicted AAA+ superfamily ATPase
MYERFLKKGIQNKIGSGKAIILVGARQVGKTN